MSQCERRRLAFQLIELAAEILVTDESFAHTDESTDDEYADLNRARRIEYSGGHDRPVLGESERSLARAASL